MKETIVHALIIVGTFDLVLVSGWLFRNDKIRVASYSLYIDEYPAESDNQFDLPFDITGDTPPEGTVLVYSESNYCIGTIVNRSCELDTVDKNSLSPVYPGDIGHKSSLSPAMSISSAPKV